MSCYYGNHSRRFRRPSPSTTYPLTLFTRVEPAATPFSSLRPVSPCLLRISRLCKKEREVSFFWRNQSFQGVFEQTSRTFSHPSRSCYSQTSYYSGNLGVVLFRGGKKKNVNMKFRGMKSRASNTPPQRQPLAPVRG